MASKALKLDFVTVDVFTQQQYEGNPLAIVTVPRETELSQKQKQTIAQEFNLSETTFVHPPGGDELEWTVDIFTTSAELPFAGHPTIGTAVSLLSNVAEALGAKDGEIKAKLNIKAGPVDVRYDVASNTATAAIPHNFHIHERKFSKEELLRLQPGLDGVNLKDGYPVVSVVKGMTFVLIELANEAALAKVGLTSQSPSDEGLDQGEDGTKVLRTRMIEKTLEDPATGSAASDLAGYLSLTEGKPGATIKFAITQGVEMGRRSNIGLEIVMAEKSGIEGVFLQGSAVQVMEGRLKV